MTETTLNIKNEVVLPPILESHIYRSNEIVNHVQEQTLEKAFVRIKATSKDNSSLQWDIPSISGGNVERNLELEIPITWSNTYTSLTTVPLTITATASNMTGFIHNGFQSNAVIPAIRPFMAQINCLDQFPLSKILRNRTYRYNNSSVSLKEDLTPEQIDALVAQFDLDKMENAGLAVFADANANFQSLVEETGGCLLPYQFSQGGTVYSGPNFGFVQPTIDTTSNDNTYQAIFFQMASDLYKVAISKDCYKSSHYADSWYSKRNSARNIVSITITSASTLTPANSLSGATSTVVLQGNSAGVIDCSASSKTLTFTVVVREQLVSLYWDHEYAFEEFSWNKLIPLSTLNMKFQYDTDYLQNSLLKISDNYKAYTAYSVSTPTIGSQEQCYYISKQCKVPNALQFPESYKVFFYDQIRPQNPVNLSLANGNSRLSATMSYANLSQIPEYLLIYLPLNKTAVAGIVGASSNYQLPSTLNAPITNLVLTINSDSGLATYEMDWYRLQQLTLENLQEDKRLRDLIVGKSTKSVGAKTGKFTQAVQGDNIPASTLLNTLYNTLQMADDATNAVYNGISNSSFYILKMGTQIRLPTAYTPSMIINWNLTVKAECDLTSPAIRNNNQFRNSLVSLVSTSDPNLGNPTIFDTTLTGQLEVVHFIKKLFTLSGDAYQNLYVHDIQITASEYNKLILDYESRFGSEIRKEMPFGADMMSGGAFNLRSALKTVAKKALPFIATLVKSKLPDQAHGAVDLAESFINSRLGSGVQNPHMIQAGRSAHVIKGGMDPHMIEGAKKPRGKASKGGANEDWKRYLQNVQ